MMDVFKMPLGTVPGEESSLSTWQVLEVVIVTGAYG